MLVLSVVLLASAAMAAVTPALTPRAAHEEWKICIPESILESCKKMSSDLAAVNVHIGCVGARDRLHCLEKIQNKEADFTHADPTEVYIALKTPNPNRFRIIKDIRAKDEQHEDICHEAVALVHKDLQITNIQGLKGLKSCHAGIGVPSGYRIPVTKLAGLGVLGQVRDVTRTSKENELRALSRFFNKTCLVGKRSADPDLDAKLKAAYPNLCELCDKPDVCDAQDRYAGNDGAIRCLTEKGADVAWTNEHQVKKHFRLLPAKHAASKVATGEAKGAGHATPHGAAHETRDAPHDAERGAPHSAAHETRDAAHAAPHDAEPATPGGAAHATRDAAHAAPHDAERGAQHKADDFRVLCPDGVKKELKGEHFCRWGACPWHGFITSDKDENAIAKIRVVIGQANKIGEEKKADWLKKVLDIDEKSVAVDTKQKGQTPAERIERADALDVLERDFGPSKPVRICTVTDDETAKCRDLARSAFSRGIRPAFGCVKKASTVDCLKAIKEGGADVISLDGGDVHRAQTEFNLKPIVREQYGPEREGYFAVAVVKKGSEFHSIEALKGAKSCHTGIGRSAGWNIPLHTLLQKGLISKTTCPHTKAVSEFFSGGSCVPGVLQPENNEDGQNPDKLCSLCVGNQAEKDPAKREKTKCALNSDEDFYGYSGAFRCLASGAGDVAFVKHTTVPENTDGHNKEAWAEKLKSSDFELLCLNGGRAPANQFKTCNLAQVPAHALVTSSSKLDHEVEAIRSAVIAAGELYSRRPELFKLFGGYRGHKDLLFKDSVTHLVAAHGVSDVQKSYADILKEVHTCVAKPNN